MRIKPRSLVARRERTTGKADFRVLVTWCTEAGEMFAHGNLASGPERDVNEEVMFFKMTYDTSSYVMRDIPRISSGFRPVGMEEYLNNNSMGVTFSPQKYVYFDVPCARKNHLKFFVPSDHTPGGEYLDDSMLDDSMFAALMDGSWETRAQWTRLTLKACSDYNANRKAWDNLLASEVVPAKDLEEVKRIFMQQFDTLIAASAEFRDLRGTMNWYRRYGLAMHLEKLSYVEFEELTRGCHKILLSVGISSFGEILKRTGVSATKKRDEVLAALAVERASDEAWAIVSRDREYLIRGGTLEGLRLARQGSGRNIITGEEETT